MTNIFSKKRSYAGFSLIELIIYIAIFAGFMLVISELFLNISSNSARENARAEVQQNLRFSLLQITNEVHSANALISPLSGVSANSLDLDMKGTTTRFSISPEGVMRKTTNLGTIDETTENITSNKVKIENFPEIFRRTDKTIQIILTISYNDNGRPDYKFSQTLQTTVSLRQ